jgi:hypothetical protein
LTEDLEAKTLTRQKGKLPAIFLFAFSPFRLFAQDFIGGSFASQISHPRAPGAAAAIAPGQNHDHRLE